MAHLDLQVVRVRDKLPADVELPPGPALQPAGGAAGAAQQDRGPPGALARECGEETQVTDRIASSHNHRKYEGCRVNTRLCLLMRRKQELFPRDTCTESMASI